MCGICGKLELEAKRTPDVEVIRDMLRSIEHRGPDDEGMYRSGPVGLGHRRLSIIDLQTGKQPLTNEDRTVWIVFNGEIYNYKELRSDLVGKGHCFSTGTDTEVIVHLYEEFGADCVKRLRGMFAFAIWDETKRVLLLARDRVGIKPLYVCRTANSLLFASEIKAILADPSVRCEIDISALDRYLTYFYVPGERTLFKNIRKLQPGHYMTVTNGQVEVTKYWDLCFDKTKKNFADATEELEVLLSQTVRDHMISDVPVGILLSGGVDSSAVLSFAVEGASTPISTFTVGFDGGCTDERPYARTVARAYGARNYDITISPKAFWECLPKYVWHMEEPVCEPPAIALYYVSKLAREYVTVLLSGEGGDEAFAGYQSHRNFFWLEKIKAFLGPCARPAGDLVQTLLSAGNATRFQKYGPLMNTRLQDYYFSHSSGPYEFFNSHRRELYSADFLDHVSGENESDFTRRCFEAVSDFDVLDQMLYVDSKTWLPDDLLVKADKMTMANSLELRVPLLDHQVLEFASSLPANYKLNGLRTKHILKTVLSQRLPAKILNRKKRGFPVPYAQWLKNELRGFMSDILLDESALARGYFQRDAVERMINASGTSDYSKELFSLVTLELLHRTFCDQKVVTCCS